MNDIHEQIAGLAISRNGDIPLPQRHLILAIVIFCYEGTWSPKCVKANRTPELKQTIQSEIATISRAMFQTVSINFNDCLQ